MPRPATPRPGFSLLRIHNSKKPHNIANLSAKAKADLIDSIAQDIEGCIWAIGHYSKLGVLNATHTLGFDQVIKDIYEEEHNRNEKMLRGVMRRLKRYKKQVRSQRKQCRRLEANLREKRQAAIEEGGSMDSDSSSVYSQMASMQTTFSAYDGVTNEQSSSVGNECDTAEQPLQDKAPIPPKESPNEPMQSSTLAPLSAPPRGMEVEYESAGDP